MPLEGGVATGFKKPEEMEFETRLYICKGKRVVHVKQIQFFRSLLNHDDVFVLDTKENIFQFNVENSNIQERAKALEYVATTTFDWIIITSPEAEIEKEMDIEKMDDETESLEHKEEHGLGLHTADIVMEENAHGDDVNQSNEKDERRFRGWK
uniref:Gelsolin-like domain-containing protein n=1 Tax=Lactuca sativa TaxID=4236 RepID=A0A9R1WN86_LACSA|nr:hypothetical protein LSAT_V11C900490640 [Lactuca sativa]